MDIKNLIQKYKKKIEKTAKDIEDYRESGNTELICAATVLEKVKEEYEIILAALEKQIPMKAKPHKKIPGICKCPICKVDLCTEDGKKIYCPDCGQAIIV